MPHIRLLSKENGPHDVYQHIIERIDSSQQSIHIHMFVWRLDKTGIKIADAVLNAAKRNVRVQLDKDSDALMYESVEMNRKPFFSKKLSLASQFFFRFMSWVMPNTYVKDDYPLTLAHPLLDYPTVRFSWVKGTHSKYYVFDENILITGSMNIEDRHLQYWDYMVEISGNDDVDRFRARYSESVPFDSSRQLDFIINKSGSFEIKPFIIDGLKKAKESVYIEMAYLGDPDITEAIIAAALRNVSITIVFSRMANVGNDINYKTVQSIFSRCSITVYFAACMVHSKLMLFDKSTVLLGSANLSVYSMQKGEELSLYIQNVSLFVSELQEEIKRRISLSQQVTSQQELNNYNKVMALLQQLYQKWL